ncbi:integral peroxisomal membrane peroxin-domain-containing protein [Ganoderma leucocontextum]|nr:integral peroxisomal membrane peroxin-domain-containing protein [Ganoderma leucocontextum]
MATMDYVDVPSYATRLRSGQSHDIRPAPKIVTSLPRPEHSPIAASPSTSQPMSPARATSNLTSMLLSSALQLPANAPAAPRAQGKGGPRLLSNKDTLSLPITTVNFKRFVSKSGPIFWVQDRVEEIVLWKKGGKYTLVWMAAYAFICYFPRLVLLLPHAVVLGVLLATHPSLKSREGADIPSPKFALPAPPSQTGEGSVDYLANLQAIQNLMGAVSDGYDIVVQLVPYLTYSSPYTSLILSFALVSFLALIPLVNVIPMRTTCLVIGLLPFFVTHPFTQHTLLPILQTSGAMLNLLQERALRFIDNDKLEDKHWRTELREVELWENERWVRGATSPPDDPTKAEGTWAKNHLKLGERKAWTRGRDGWSGVADDGSGEVSSNLTFSLSPGWFFVETEDWRPDLGGSWVLPEGADESGWVYTNDTWLYPHAHPLEDWMMGGGMTRRRRWTRRIYYSPETPA